MYVSRGEGMYVSDGYQMYVYASTYLKFSVLTSLMGMFGSLPVGRTIAESYVYLIQFYL